MNTANPFQIPECFQKANLELRRRERFKRGVISIVFAVMALLVVLLIQGCMSERAQTGAGNEVTFTPYATGPGKNTAANPQPATSTVSEATTAAKPALPAVQKPAPAAKAAEIIYVVKSGDSLSRIARQHGTTIKAIKSANDLASDRIFVGDKLKIPQA